MGTNLCQLLLRHRAMLARRIASVPPPQTNQAQGRQTGPEQCGLPSQSGHERRDEGRRQCRAQPQAHGLQALHEGPLTRRKPFLEDAGRHRENTSLCATEQNLYSEQGQEQSLPGEKIGRERRRNGCQKSGEPNHDERAACAETLTYHPAGQLENRVSENESLFQQADLELAQVEIRHHAIGGHRDALLLHVGNEAEAE